MRHDQLPGRSETVVRFREVAAPALRRARSFAPQWRDVGDGKPKTLSMLASTAEAVDWGGYREILSHDDGAVDWRAATALLINHNPNQLAGRLTNLRLGQQGLESDAELIDGAMMASGVSVKAAIDAGALRGVSVGYTYSMKDTSYDEDTRTLTVRKWRLLEVSLTPIPADDEASLRSRSAHVEAITDHHRAAPAPTQKDPAMKFEQWLAARGFDAAKLNETQTKQLRAIFDAGGLPPEDFAPEARTIDEAARAREIAELRERAVKAERESKLRAMAQEHGIDVAGVDFSKFQDEAAGLRHLMGLKSRAAATGTPKTPLVTVTVDEVDKLLSRAAGALHASARTAPEANEKAAIDAVGGVRMMNMKRLLTALARAEGHRDADEWSDVDLGVWLSRHLDLSTNRRGVRDISAANKVAAGFATLLANVATKAIVAGMSGYNASTWQFWATVRNVPNFLAVTNAGLQTGRLQLTKEDEAFPELLQKDGGYSSTLGLFGGTVSLTWQMIVNDQLGQFMDSLRRIGATAALTIDRLVYSTLLGATWTNDLNATKPLSTISNLDAPRASLKTKLGPTGEKLGIIGRYLLHDPANAVNAQLATGAIYAPGQQVPPSLASRSMVPIESHWIGDTAILGGALTTDYYVAGDPNVVDTVLVNFLEGVGQTPIIMPFDPGAVAAEKYKVMLPVQATAATHTDSAGNSRVTGIQKATA